MASLTKTGLSDGNTLTAVMITDLYDAWMGNKSYDNIAINNSTLRVRHDGKISIGTAATDHAVNVEGTVSASAFIGGSITLTTGGTLSLGSASTGSFGRLLQNSWESGESVGTERVASPSYFNQNQTTALELDDDGNLQFINSSFTGSKFLVDRYFDVDSNNDFQPKVQFDMGVSGSGDYPYFTSDS